MEVKILGISGSMRKDSGTEHAVQEALKAAQEIDADITTEFISLNSKKINTCIHCDRCFKKGTLCALKDDFQEVQKSFLEADGFILGSPVYNMNVTPVLSAFMSRVRPTYLVHPGHFTRKVGGAIAVGGGRNGGQEMTILNIHNFYQTYEILCCGGSLAEPAGAMLWSRDGSREGAKNDAPGNMGAVRIGKRVAQTAAFLKFGWECFEKEGKNIYITQKWFDY
ncbi:flavodoxin family protein [Candidatus Formimonas warabiya]|uniref:NADPH-dependent FMN reductase-like domain-containing protein n=1 Tax=Formimonas warabiya TaxID=1761012 RepID=A0A3G1KTR6_FORW1|nr:flavodoxin family protein [Candidatus Formimonas warabiya]ATW25858.1 hypothetical protein DCMF_14745 [Candidatus Formimonas warabiya]